MVTFSQIERSLIVDQIVDIENLVGLDFPSQFKEHILKYNGGQPTPNVFSFEENGKLTDSYVDWFLAIYDGEYDNLRNYIGIYKIEQKRLPAHILPIAHDPGGNLICISCSKKDYGFIYFWDHEKEVDYSVSDDSDYSNLYLIANSFNEFIDGLKKDLNE